MKAHIKLTQRIHTWGLLLMTLLLIPGTILATNSKTFTLRSKMAEISSLRQKVTERKVQAAKLCEQLKQRIRELEKEIRGEIRNSEISFFQEAILNPRIDHNIKLIQKTFSYVSRLKEKIQFLNIASEELAFFYQLAEDDLRILETLKDMKIEKLTDQIDQISAKYQSEASRLVIDSDGIVLNPPEDIWESIMRD
ncbi:MAG: hypothetical protein JSV50_16225 [Desulfobacteraceae bacterium]|nr:MAG: hypothetical protein JSV50_16225 [Desulfobacteraceae bacterium]